MDKFCPGFIWMLIAEKKALTFIFLNTFFFGLKKHKLIMVRFYEIYIFIRLLLGNEKD